MSMPAHVVEWRKSRRAELHAIAASIRRERQAGAAIEAEAASGAQAMPRAELLELLNTLLEAERAGAKVLAAFLSDYPAGGAASLGLGAVQRDEAKYLRL